MAQVVCQALVNSKRLTLRWSEAESGCSFEPYYLEAEELKDFWRVVGEVNQRGAELIAAGDDGTGLSKAAFELARAGYQLRARLFPASPQFGELTAEIQNWLQEKNHDGTIQGFEVTGDTVGLVPWQFVYDREPEASLFERAGEDYECWRPFWGIRYPLGVTHRVNPLRDALALEKLNILLAASTEWQEALPPEERDKLRYLADDLNLAIVDAYRDLAEVLESAAPDLLLLHTRMNEKGLHFADGALTPEALTEVLRSNESAQVPWNDLILVLNPWFDGDPADWMGFLEQWRRLRFSGLIAPERPVAPSAACRFTLEFGDRFLNRGDSAGLALQNARAMTLPTGVLFSSLCPPGLHVVWQEAVDNSDQPPIGEQAWPALPEEPYHPLIPLDREERALLVGRDEDLANFCRLIDEPGVRLALLHGRSGVGKSSLLRAGVIPHLDEQALGYLPLRDRSEKAVNHQSERDFPVVSIRATNDLPGQLAPALCAFAASSFSFTTPTQRNVTVDLQSLLRQVIERRKPVISTSITRTETSITEPGSLPAPSSESPTQTAAPSVTSPQQVYSALSEDPGLLGEFLSHCSERLPFELVLLIEQAEEWFSLSRTGEDVQKRLHALAILACLANSAGHSKAILSLNTAYLGRLTTRVRRQLNDVQAAQEYLLPALNVEQLTHVILRPTSEEPIPYSPDIPAEKYGFRIAEELPQKIAREAIESVNAGKEESLPLVHAVCAQLYQGIQEREGSLMSAEDLTRIGGIAGGLERYVELLASAVVLPTERERLYDLMRQMYTRQPDGALTRQLFREEQLAQHWNGRTPFDKVVESAAADGIGLFDERASVTAQGEQILVSLGHDVCTPVLDARRQKEELRHFGRRRVVDTLWFCVPIMILIAMAAYAFFARPYWALLDEQEKLKKGMAEFLKEQSKEFQVTANSLQRSNFFAQLERARLAWKSGDTMGLRRILLAQEPASQPFQGFAWRFLQNQAHPALYEWTGHQSIITALATSPKDGVLLSGSADGVIKAWNLDNGSALSIKLPHQPQGTPSLPEYLGPIHSLAISPDGSRLSVANKENNIHLWELTLDSSGKTLEVKEDTTLIGHGKAVRCAAFAANDSLISADEDGVVKLWNLEKGDAKNTLKEHKGKITTLAVGRDGDVAATAGIDRKVIVWDLKEEKIKHKIDSLSNKAVKVAFSPNGKVLALLSNKHRGGVVQFWDVSSGKESRKALPLPRKALSMQFTPDGKGLLIGDRDHSISLWDLASGKIAHRYRGHVGWVGCLTVGQNGKKLISGSYDSTIQVWRFPPRPAVIRAHEGGVYCAALSPDDRYLATGGADKQAKVWDLQSGRMVVAIKDHSAPVRAVAITEFDNKFVLASGSDKEDNEPGKLLLSDLETGARLKELKGHSGTITGVAFSPDGNKLASASDDETVKIWDVEKGKAILTYKEHKAPVRCAIFTVGDVSVATGGADGDLRLWEAIDGRDLRFGDPPRGLALFPNEQMRHTTAVNALEFMPFTDAVLLASASSDHTIQVWDAKTALPTTTLSGHLGPVNCLAFQRGSTDLISGGAEGAVHVWDLRVGRSLLKLDDHEGPVHGVALSSDQQTLISAGADGTIRLYYAPP